MNGELYVWAGATPDDVPDRVPVRRCTVCLVLVEVDVKAEHDRYHADRGEGVTR